MRRLFTLIAVFQFFTLFGQVNVTSESYPFHDAVEWQGVGSLLLAKDPSSRQKDYNVILLNTLGEAQWKEKFYPKNDNPSLILGHKSNYIYFLDNFVPENHKLFYHQINMGGSVKSTYLEVLTHAKKLGYSSSTDLKLVDVANTNGALIFQFVAENKSDKSYDNVFIFLTHHNHRTYAVKTLSSNMEGVKENTEAMLKYAGSDEEQIYFSRLIDRAGKSTIEFIPFSAKGEEGFTQVFTLSDQQSISMELNPMHFSGDYYISSGFADYKAKAYGYFLAGQFYTLTFDVKGSKFIISRFDEKGIHQPMVSEPISKDKKDKYAISVGLMEIQKSLLISVGVNEENFHARVESTSSIFQFPSGISTLQFMKNPSIIQFGKSSTIFVHPMAEGFLSTSLVGIGKTASLDFE